MTAETTLLFDNLPLQEPPKYIEAAEYFLGPCKKCKGSGRRRFTYYGGNYYSERSSEKCSSCGGGGKTLTYVGPAVHDKSTTTPSN